MKVFIDRLTYHVTKPNESAFAYNAKMRTFSNYYPFGMEQLKRRYSSGENRFGFQGQEIDRELFGGAVSYKYRVHDPRIGRFLSIDPLTADYPHYTPYSFSGNKVIHAIELEGLEEFVNLKFINNDGSTAIYKVHEFDLEKAMKENRDLGLFLKKQGLDSWGAIQSFALKKENKKHWDGREHWQRSSFVTFGKEDTRGTLTMTFDGSTGEWMKFEFENADRERSWRYGMSGNGGWTFTNPGGQGGARKGKSTGVFGLNGALDALTATRVTLGGVAGGGNLPGTGIGNLGTVATKATSTAKAAGVFDPDVPVDTTTETVTDYGTSHYNETERKYDQKIIRNAKGEPIDTLDSQ